MSPARALDRKRSAKALKAWQDAGLLSVGRRRVLREGEILLSQGPGGNQAALSYAGS